MPKAIKIYETEIRTLISLPEKQRLNVITAILCSCINEPLPELNSMENAVFTLINDQVKRAEELSNRRRESVRSRWKKDTSSESDNTKDIQTDTNTIQNCTNSESDDTNLYTNTITNTNTTTSTITDTPHTPSKGEKGAVLNKEQQERFDRFWAAYPKKTKKQDTLKAWKKLNPDEELVKQILLALEQQKKSAQWQGDNGRYIPYPVTWLNGRRWEDDVDMPGCANQQDSNEHSYNVDLLVQHAMNNTPKIKN